MDGWPVRMGNYIDVAATTPCSQELNVFPCFSSYNESDIRLRNSKFNA